MILTQWQTCQSSSAASIQVYDRGLDTNTKAVIENVVTTNYIETNYSDISLQRRHVTLANTEHDRFTAARLKYLPLFRGHSLLEKKMPLR